MQDTLPPNQASRILRSLSILNINVILHGFSTEKSKNQFELYQAIENIIDKTKEPFTKYESEISQIKTFNNLNIDLFAKAKSDENISWDSTIPEKYKASFYVQTWPLPEHMASLCNDNNETL